MQTKTNSTLTLSTLFILFFLLDCQSNQSLPTPDVFAKATSISDVKITPSITPVQPSPSWTPTPIPTQTPVPTETPTPTITPTPLPPVIEPSNVNKLVKSSWGEGIYEEVYWSPDGQHIIVSASDEIHWLDPNTLNIIKSISIHESFNTEFSPDGSIAAESSYGAIKLWDMGTGELLSTINSGGTSDMSFSHDGQTLVSSGGKAIRVWDTDTGLLKQEYTNLDGGARVSISPDGRWLAVGITTSSQTNGVYRFDGRLQIWDLQTGTVSRTLSNYRLIGVEFVTFSPDGKILAAKTRRGIEFWDMATNRLIDKTSASWLQGVAFASNGSTVALASRHYVILRDIQNGEILGYLETPTEDELTLGVSFSPDESKIVAIGRDWIRVWDMATQEIIATKQLDALFYASAVDAQNNIIATGLNGQPVIRLHDMQTGRILQILTDESASSKHRCYVFSPSGRYLARCAGPLLEMWDTLNGGLMYTISGAEARGIAFSPDGKQFAMVGDRNAIRFYSTTSGEMLSSITLDTGTNPLITEVAYSYDGNFIAIGGGGDAEKAVYVYSVITGDKILTFDAGTSFRAFAWHPHDDFLAVASDDGNIHLLDVTRDEVLQEYNGHSNGIGSIAFNPDGKWLLASSGSGILLWDVNSGKVLQQIDDAGLTFSSDGRTLIRLGFNKIYLWQIQQ